MFTIKHYFYNNENYHVFSAATYFVDRNPTVSREGSAADPVNAVHDVRVGGDPDTIYPRISMDLADGTERVIDVCGTCYIENAAGKTIDVIKPHLPRGIARTT